VSYSPRFRGRALEELQGLPPEAFDAMVARIVELVDEPWDANVAAPGDDPSGPSAVIARLRLPLAVVSREHNVAPLIRMPTKTELPDGARRRFVEELFETFKAANRPPLRDPSTATPPTRSPPGWLVPQRKRARGNRSSERNRPSASVSGRNQFLEQPGYGSAG
jgi:hypothetical protein